MLLPLFVIGAVVFTWLMARLFFSGLPSLQSLPPRTSTQQIISGVLRVSFFIWFVLCGGAAIFGLGFLLAVGKANGGMKSSLSSAEWDCFGIAAMPILMGMVAAFALGTKRAIILWGRTAYGFHVAGMLFLFSLENRKGDLMHIMAAIGMILLLCAPIHLGWLGFTFFPKIQSVERSHV